MKYDNAILDPQYGKEMRIKITLKNKLAEIERMAGWVRDFGRENWPSEELVWQIRLVLEEVVTNIISYGYENQADHIIEVQIADAEQAVTLSVRDDACPFNLLEHPVPDLEIPVEDRKIGGMGIHMVRQIMDTIDYKREAGENRLLMRKSKKLGS